MRFFTNQRFISQHFLLFLLGISLICSASSMPELKIKQDAPAGSMPRGWYMFHKPFGVSKVYSRENSPTFLITGPADFRSTFFDLPKTGTLKVKIIAKTISGTKVNQFYMIGDKYKWLCCGSFPALSSWKEFEIQKQLPAKIVNNRKGFVRINVPAGNTVLISEIKTERIEDHQEKFRSTEGELIENSDFSGGGWGWTTTWRVTPNKVSFHDGKMFAGPKNSIISWNIKYNPDQLYTAYIRLRSQTPGKSGTVIFHAINRAWKLSSKKIQITDQFETFFLTFKLPVSCYNTLYLRLDTGHSSVEVDRFGLTPGKTSVMPPLPETILYPLEENCFDSGKNGIFRMLYCSNGKGETLPVTVTDASGKTVGSCTLKLSPKKEQVLELPISTDHPRGVFLVNVPGVKPIRYAVMKNLAAKKIVYNPYATHFSLFEFRGNQLFDRYLPTTGSFNRSFEAKNDKALEPEFLNAISKTGRPEMLTLVFPKFTPSNECDWEKYGAEFLEYVKRRIHAWKGKVRGVELFNEPHLYRLRKGPDAGKATMPPEKLAKIYRAVYPVIKEIDPAMMVMGPCCQLTEPGYAQRFVKAGGGEAIDAVTFHAYTPDPELHRQDRFIREFRRIFGKKGKNIPFYNTEAYFGLRGSVITDSDVEAVRSYFKDTEFEHARACVSMLLVHASEGVSWCDYWPLYSINGFSNDAVFATQAAAAINNSIDLLSDCGPAEKIELEADLNCFCFPKAKDGPLAVMRNLGETDGEMVLPEGVKVFDMFGNERKGKSQKLGRDIIYLRFPKQSDPIKALRSIRFSGFGPELSGTVSMPSRKTLSLSLKNRRSFPVNAKAEIITIPEEWEFGEIRKGLLIPPLKTVKFDFPISKGCFDQGTQVSFRFKLSGNKESNIIEKHFTPFLSVYSRTLDLAGAPVMRMNGKNLSVPMPEKWKNEQDLSADIRSVWNETGLRLQVETVDDKFIPPKNMEYAYRQDSLQVYFDMLRNASPEADKYGRNFEDDLCYNIGLLNGSTPQAYLSFSNGSRFIGEANATTGIDDAVKVKIKHEGTRTVYDLFFPAEILHQVRLVPGSIFGFSLLINDNDGSGRKQGLTLSPSGTEPYRKPSGYMDMILMK